MPRGPGWALENPVMEIIAILSLVVTIIYTVSFIYFEATRH